MSTGLTFGKSKCFILFTQTRRTECSNTKSFIATDLNNVKMDKTENLQSFCRVCAHHSDQTCDLLKTKYNEITLFEMLEYCLNRSCKQADNFPRRICLNCHTNLISTYEFHKLCESSEIFFMELLTSNDLIEDTIPEHVLCEVKYESECDFFNTDVNHLADINCESKPEIKSETLSGENSIPFVIFASSCDSRPREAKQQQHQSKCGNKNGRLLSYSFIKYIHKNYELSNNLFYN